ncbi:membrane protein [Streptomyces sulfonofaciens]|uniref:Membrane protein n=1 Tax=Streptomyces sulfonofaciens TaxID=68272 RepID=A0A919KRA3_9ACTN|nr:membrane protein [Streptomyces sulfonofaciens]
MTDTRGSQAGPYEGYGASQGYDAAGAPPSATPLPGERQPSAPQGPYHPPEAYQTPPDAVRRPRTGARTAPRTRKARLRVAKADPWSVMKVSFLLSIALGICTVIAATVLWMVMDAMGVFSTVGGTISEATGSNDAGGFDLQSFLSLPRVLTFTGIIAVIDVVLATALATLGAFIYNLSAGFMGGVELTLAEDE